MLKKCSKCCEEKDLNEFHKNPQAKDGHSYICRTCTSKLQKEYRKKKSGDKYPYMTKSPESKADIHTFIPRVKKLEGKVRQFYLHLCPRCTNQIKMEFVESNDSEDIYYGGCDKCGCDVDTTISCSKKKA